MVTMATDLCNRLPIEHERMAFGYIYCVQFLLYQPMQKLVWRLQNKWGVQFNEHYAAQNEMGQNALLAIYTEKKMIAWEEMLKIYGKHLMDLTEKNEQIRRKFEFCLVIEGETQLKCDPISIKNAQIFIKFFHRNVYEPEFEQKPEPTLRVRVQVLVNMAQQKCRKLRKNPFNNIAKLGRSISARFERARSVKNAKDQQSANANANNNDNNNNESGGGSSSNAADAENGLDEISSDFVTCVYHFMEKTRKRLEMAFYEDDVQEMEKWLNGEKTTAEASSDGVEDQAEEEVEDPFKNCANVQEWHTNGDEVPNGEADLLDKSFDEYLFPCASQFFAAVAGDKFKYEIFVNFYTMQLDTAMEFPNAMKDTTPTNGQHNANDKCFMMRELLMSLNKNLAHRLNFQKITTREEKEHWTSLHQKYENLRLEKLDNNWLHRMGVKLSQSYQNVVRQLHKWNAKGTLTHPIRDEYRKALEGMGRVMGKLRKSVRRQKRTNEENDGDELLKTLQDEMKLNLDQFNMSFDGQCDPTTDLSDCFVASDGLDFDGQIEKLSLFGKKKGELGALERAAEMIPKMMTDQMSPFEIVIPFYLPMKNLTKYTLKKVVVKPGERLRALFIKLIAITNLSINGEKKHKLEKEKGHDDIERDNAIVKLLTAKTETIMLSINIKGEDVALLQELASMRREGSSTAAALLVDAKVVDWSLTAPLPGLQLHWLHINHGIMLGKHNIATSLTTGILVIFILVSMLYWWHALKLSVYLAILYGDNAGWACIFVATIFYIILCVGFFIG
uniref:RING-type domain-containing protein n=1 Tax=Globodera pallida TaxID=36090 RepID=A0A183CIW4_GLOPA